MTYLLEFAVSFVSLLMSFVFFDTFVKADRLFQQRVPYIFSAAGALLTVLTGHADIRFGYIAAAAYIITAAAHKLFFKAGTVKALGIAALYFAVAASAFFISTVLLSDDSISNAVRQRYERTMILLVAAVMLSVFCIAFRRQALSAQYDRKKQNRLLILVFAILLAAAGMTYFHQFYSDMNSHRFTVLKIGIVVILLTIYIVAYYISAQARRREAEWYDLQNTALEKALREQELNFSRWRRSIHDYKNTILALNAMAEKGEYSELTRFLSEEKESLADRAEYFHTGSSAADTVINTKYSVAKENGIPFTVNARLPEHYPVSETDLARLIGNLIDNALEASQKESEPFIEVMLSSVRGFLLINITNCCTAPPDITRTSKADKHHHGIGLNSGRDIAEKNNGSFQLVFEDGRAIATVMIPN